MTNLFKKVKDSAGLLKVKSFTIFPAIRRKIQFLFPSKIVDLKPRSFLKSLNLKILNILLGLAAIFLSIYLIVDFAFGSVNIDQFFKKLSKTKRLRFEESSLTKVKPFLYYLEMIQRRNIFSPIVYKTVEETKTEIRETMKSLTANIKLVGISWDSEPTAMIEDTKTLKTYFLKQGDIIGEFKVEEIFKDRVILSYKEGKFELM